MKFPLLEQMRWQREQREAAAVAPWRAEAKAKGAQLAALDEERRKLQRMLAGEIGKAVVEHISHELSRAICKAITTAVPSKSGEYMTLKISTDALRFGSPSLLERRLLNDYLNHALPALKLSAGDGMMEARERIKTMTVHIPAVNFREVVDDHIP